IRPESWSALFWAELIWSFSEGSAPASATPRAATTASAQAPPSAIRRRRKACAGGRRSPLFSALCKCGQLLPVPAGLAGGLAPKEWRYACDGDSPLCGWVPRSPHIPPTSSASPAGVSGVWAGIRLCEPGTVANADPGPGGRPDGPSPQVPDAMDRAVGLAGVRVLAARGQVGAEADHGRRDSDERGDPELPLVAPADAPDHHPSDQLIDGAHEPFSF